jgi:hypothetical protein
MFVTKPALSTISEACSLVELQESLSFDWSLDTSRESLTVVNRDRSLNSDTCNSSRNRSFYNDVSISSRGVFSDNDNDKASSGSDGDKPECDRNVILSSELQKLLKGKALAVYKVRSDAVCFCHFPFFLSKRFIPLLHFQCDLNQRAS